MVWDVGRLCKRHKLWSKLSHTIFHGTLHVSEGARGEETLVVDRVAVFLQVLEAVDLRDEFEDLATALILELLLFKRGPEEVELEVP